MIYLIFNKQWLMSLCITPVYLEQFSIILGVASRACECGVYNIEGNYIRPGEAWDFAVTFEPKIYVKNNDNQLIYRYKNDESVKC